MNLADTPSMSGLAAVRERIVGIDQLVRVLDGAMRSFINPDSTASTPTLRDPGRCERVGS